MRKIAGQDLIHLTNFNFMSVKQYSMPAKKFHRSPSVMRIESRALVFLLVLAFSSGIGAHLLFAKIFAQNAPPDGVIQVCVKRNGEMRLLTERRTSEKERRFDREGCRRDEMIISWNIQGPPGPQGPAGGGAESVPFICSSCDITDSIGDRLKGKNLSNAVLVNANLSSANLEGVNFSNANLRNVDFTNANLKDANLLNANLSGAIWSNTICPNGINSNETNQTCLP